MKVQVNRLLLLIYNIEAITSGVRDMSAVAVSYCRDAVPFVVVLSIEVVEMRP